MEHKEAYSLCQQHMHRYVGVQMTDGSIHDGIVESVDEHYLYLAVPTGEVEGEQMRALLPFGFPVFGGFGFPGFGFPGFFFPRRRFFRRVLPLGGITGLSLLPFF